MQRCNSQMSSMSWADSCIDLCMQPDIKKVLIAKNSENLPGDRPKAGGDSRAIGFLSLLLIIVFLYCPLGVLRSKGN